MIQLIQHQQHLDTLLVVKEPGVLVIRRREARDPPTNRTRTTSFNPKEEEEENALPLIENERARWRRTIWNRWIERNGCWRAMQITENGNTGEKKQRVRTLEL